jgi:hypothetical protein
MWIYNVYGFTMFRDLQCFTWVPSDGVHAVSAKAGCLVFAIQQRTFKFKKFNKFNRHFNQRALAEAGV